MAVRAVRNITLALESNVRYYYFEAELTEDVGNWVEMKMKKEAGGSNYMEPECIKRSDGTTYSTDDTDTTYSSRSAGAASVKTDASKIDVATMVFEQSVTDGVDMGAWRELGYQPNKS